MASAEETFNKIQNRLAQTIREMPAIIAEEAVNFTLDNFERQAWLGDSNEPWQKRKNPTKWGKKDDPTRALLVGEGSGRLKRSIRSRVEEDNKFSYFSPLKTINASNHHRCHRRYGKRFIGYSA